MAKISDHDINAIREKADIVDVIGHYIQVHRKGNSYVAICPFHDDHDPSMSISPEKKIYKCFVCGSGGNVYTFVQNYENITFPEAVGRVASLIILCRLMLILDKGLAKILIKKHCTML